MVIRLNNLLRADYYDYAQPLSDINGSRLVQLNDCTCVGYTQTFRCTVFGGGFTLWNSTFLTAIIEDQQLKFHCVTVNMMM